MNFTLSDLAPALPEVFVLAMACGILLFGALTRDSRLAHVLTLLTLLGAAALTAFTAGSGTSHAFGGQFVDDAMADVLKLMSYFATLAVVVYSRAYLAERGLWRGEFHALTLLALLGAMVMISANHFLVLYVGLELMSLSLYALVAFQRDSALATEAGMKYFVLGALASGLLLYGMSLIYGLTGTLELPTMQAILRAGARDSLLLAFGLVFLVAGLGFKLGVAPFHMWLPDIYQGAPTAVTLFLGSAPKLAAFAFTMRLLVDGLEPAIGDWQGMLAVMAVLSLAIGNLAAIMQSNIKRMLAYSTISHMGFVLLGVLTGSLAGYSSGLYYAIIYVLMGVGTFGLVVYLSQGGFEADALDDYKGLNQRHPWLAAIMAMLMFSLAGLPPFVGFYAKLYVLQALVGADWIWLAVVAVLFSLIGAFYYLRVVKLMYFDSPVADAPVVARQGGAQVLLSVNGLAVLVLGLVPQALIALCNQAMQLSLQ
ncbi:MAG TPA: NADH-quinone oxidoreductase subunit NuoN [Thiobacillaceae bacterium]|nr:NADH-quinone oxidoreductase subunit NuoN [Thiobacillaceae bacterium]HNU63964.1 NADH-quinone oxidoreductase subunit NuoN [Thiobacillaceae bacterium]